MFERFTDRARRSVVLAQEEARRLNHDHIGTEHILLGLVREGDGVAARALASLNVSLKAVRGRVEEVIGRGKAPVSGHMPFTPRAKKVLELALREALQMGLTYIGTEHILLGLIREGEGVAAQVLVALGADLDHVRQAVMRLLEGYSAEPEMKEVARTPVITHVGHSRERPPTCPNCSAPLEDALAVRVVTTQGEDPRQVEIAYCNRCGVALGTIS